MEVFIQSVSIQRRLISRLKIKTIPLKPSSCESAAALLDFFDWTFKNGGEVAEACEYAAVTKPVYNIIGKDWSRLECGGKPLWKK